MRVDHTDLDMPVLINFEMLVVSALLVVWSGLIYGAVLSIYRKKSERAFPHRHFKKLTATEPTKPDYNWTFEFYFISSITGGLRTSSIKKLL